MSSGSPSTLPCAARDTEPGCSTTSSGGGFVYVDTIDPLPGWPPGNPAAIYVAAIRPTRGEP